MRKDTFYTVVDDILHPEDLIPDRVKIQSLNTAKFKLEELLSQTSDQIVKVSISTILTSIEDAYNIYMYRFQFQLFMNIINKEVQNFEDIIAFSAKI